MLDTKQIKHIAHLARIELTRDEQQKFAKDLGDIFGYFGKLKKLDTAGIEPTSQSIELKNIYRPDEAKNCQSDIQENILNNLPDKSGRYFKVDKIL